MATQVWTNQSANTTTEVHNGGRAGKVQLITAQAAGTLAGASVRLALSPTGSATTYQILSNSTVDPGSGAVNLEVAGGFHVAAIMTSASAGNTAINLYVAAAEQSD